MRRIRVVSALVAAGFGLLIVVQSLLPGAPYLPDGVEFIPFVLAFPLFGWALIERAQLQVARERGQPRKKWYEQGMRSTKELNRSWAYFGSQTHKYRVQLAVAVPVVALMWIIGVISIASSQGQPVHSGNRYYLDDHGSHVSVSRAGYENAIANQERLFAAGGTGFLVVAAAMTMTFDPKKSNNLEPLRN